MSSLNTIVPFSEMNSGMIPSCLHAMVSIKDMLAVMNKGIPLTEVADLPKYLEITPDIETLEIFKKNVKNAVEAAALVIMHSTYENSVFQLIERLIRYTPNDWRDKIKSKQISFDRLRDGLNKFDFAQFRQSRKF